MAFIFNGTSQYLSASSAPASGPPLSFACWAKPTSTSLAAAAICIASASGAHRFQLVRLAGASAKWRANAVSAVSTGFAETAKASSAGTWSHVAAVFASDSSRTAYLDGGNSGSSSLSSTLTEVLTQTLVGAAFSSGVVNYWGGDLAEVGVWNVALTAEEIASLGKGVTCDQVRPQSLVFYAPLIRDIADFARGSSMTNVNAATVAEHPRVYV